MRFTAREQTGLRAMIALSRNFGQGPTALSAIAQSQQLPLPYLEQVAGALRRAGLLGSVRGARGGYFLTRDPAEVSVSDVLSALEGQLVSLECLRPGGSGCAQESTCDVRGVWQRVQDCLDQTLGEMMLADVM
ncbi:MAG: RrF2 family transcriptional regulator [Anaerolineae bacterium]